MEQWNPASIQANWMFYPWQPIIFQITDIFPMRKSAEVVVNNDIIWYLQRSIEAFKQRYILPKHIETMFLKLLKGQYDIFLMR